MLQIKIDSFEMIQYQTENSDVRIVKDIDFYKGYVFVLYDKNEVAVYDL